MELRVASTERALIRELRRFLARPRDNADDYEDDDDNDDGCSAYATEEQAMYMRDKFKDVQVTTSPLDVGDILLVHKGETCFAVERKSLDDLNASIFDGRYQDQAVRLHSSGVVSGSPRQVLYLIECDLRRWAAMSLADQLKWNRVKASLMISPGHDFLLLESQSVSDSAFKLLCFATRALEVLVDFEKKPGQTAEGTGVYFAGKQSAGGATALGWTPLSTEYVQRQVLESIVVARKRQFNVIPEHFVLIALGCVPGVGSEIAKSVGALFPTVQDILSFLSDAAKTPEEVVTELSNVMVETGRRRIGESVARSIAKFFCPQRFDDAAAAAAVAGTKRPQAAAPQHHQQAWKRGGGGGGGRGNGGGRGGGRGRGGGGGSLQFQSTSCAPGFIDL